MGNDADEGSALGGSPGAERSALFARPLLWLSVAFIAGVAVVGLHLPSDLRPIIALVAALFAAWLFFSFSRSTGFRLHAVFSPMLFWGLGVLAGSLATPRLPAPSSLLPFFNRPQTLFLAEVVSSPEFHPDKTRLSLRLHKVLTELGSVPVEGGVLLSVGKSRSVPGEWLVGDKLLARLTLKPFHNFNNPGCYDYVYSQARKGFYAKAYAADGRLLVKVSEGSPSYSSRIASSIEKRLDLFRQRALFWLKEHLESDCADFFAALLLGYRIPKSWGEHLSRAGVTHLLSISGLHLGLVSMSVFWLFRRLVRLLAPSLLRRASDQHPALWAALFAALLYALVSGLTLPTWRSLIMLGLFFGALSRYRRPDALTALAAAALIILLIAPNNLWDISFQFSFAAMFGLFIVYPRFRHLQSGFWRWTLQEERLIRTLLNPFCDAFWVSLAANAAVLPLVVYHFHGLSLAGFAANALLVPAVGFLVLPVGLVSLALFAINEHLALPFLKLGAWLLQYCLDAILWFSGLSWAFFWVGALSVTGLFIIYAAMALALARSSLPRKVAGIAMLGFFFFAIMIFKPFPTPHGSASTLEVVAIDVGQGSSTLARFPTGETMLIDGGGFYDDSFDIGRSVLAPFLWSLGLRRIDYVVLSHDHPDHRNGLRFILSHFEVGRLWETGISDGARGFDEAASIASKRNIPVCRLPEIAGVHDIGGCRVRILHPTPQYIEQEWDREDLNNVSLVVQIDYGSTSLIVPGDIDRFAERYVFSSYDAVNGQALLFSPHHGSGRSNSPFLLDALAPRAVVFSCGWDNLFGFPSSAVLEEYRKRNIPHFRTDLHGAVRAVSDGVEWIEIGGMK